MVNRRIGFRPFTIYYSPFTSSLPLKLRRADDERGDARDLGVADRDAVALPLAARGADVLLLRLLVLGRGSYRRVRLRRQLPHQDLAALRRDVSLQSHVEEALDDRLLVNGAAAHGLLADEAREVNARAGDAVRDEREREVQTLKQRARVDPVARLVRVARRRLVAVERLAHARDPLDERGPHLHVRAERAQRAHRQLERRLDLRAPRFARVELGRVEDGAQRRLDVAARRVERVGHALDERRVGRVGDELAHELRRDELRGRGVRDEDVQALLAVRLAAARGYL